MSRARKILRTICEVLTVPSVSRGQTTISVNPRTVEQLRGQLRNAIDDNNRQGYTTDSFRFVADLDSTDIYYFLAVDDIHSNVASRLGLPRGYSGHSLMGFVQKSGGGRYSYYPCWESEVWPDGVVQKIRHHPNYNKVLDKINKTFPGSVSAIYKFSEE